MGAGNSSTGGGACGNTPCRPFCCSSKAVNSDMKAEKVAQFHFSSASEASVIPSAAHPDYRPPGDSNRESNLKLGELPSTTAPDTSPVHFPSGAIYAGEWRGQARHGFGVQRWPDGASYEGSWRDNCAEGLGRFLFKDGDFYVGEWQSNMFHGLGAYYGRSGTFCGSWVRDKQEGLGIVNTGGMTYKGLFCAGQKHGYGVCTWPDTSEYSGEWDSNVISGCGRYDDGCLFRGQWARAEKHGAGRYDWPDGRSYWGQYAQDKANGFGIFKWPDGRVYEGWWSEGKQQDAPPAALLDGSA